MIKQKVALVTGGAKGIGKEIVNMLVNENYYVFLNYNNSIQEAQKFKEDLNRQGLDCDIIKADISKEDEVINMINYITSKFNYVDVLVNNAGRCVDNLFTDFTKEEYDNIFSTNVYGTFLVTKYISKLMINKHNGCIINISSIYGNIGGSCEVLYSASKAAINGFTKALAKELSLSNIRVNAIAPGMVLTDMTSMYSEEDINSIRDEIPLGRLGNTLDIAKCVKWLTEDTYVTGQIISINGGWDI